MGCTQCCNEMNPYKKDLSMICSTEKLLTYIKSHIKRVELEINKMASQERQMFSGLDEENSENQALTMKEFSLYLKIENIFIQMKMAIENYRKANQFLKEKKQGEKKQDSTMQESQLSKTGSTDSGVNVNVNAKGNVKEQPKLKNGLTTKMITEYSQFRLNKMGCIDYLDNLFEAEAKKDMESLVRLGEELQKRIFHKKNDLGA